MSKEVEAKHLFTSDFHFHHKNIIQYENRPHDNVDDMHEALIAIWNNQVSPDDNVYHIGDFCFGNLKKTELILSRLNGRKFFILGNHDDEELFEMLDKERFNIGWIKHKAYIKIEGQSIVLDHFPHFIWNKMHHGSFMIHGHCHGNAPRANKKQLDVGIDNARKHHGGARLFEFSEIKSLMEDKPVIKLDHHAEGVH